jgi:OOP family OmpA-OmpF porin
MCKAAFADETTTAPGFYFGGELGESTAKGDARLSNGEGIVNTFHFDKQDNAYQAFMGYQFSPWLGVEGGYVDFGSPSHHFNEPPFGDVRAKVDASGWQGFVVGTLPVGPIDLFAKAGAIDADVRLKVHDQTFGLHRSEDETNHALAYGAGAEYNIGQFSVRAEMDDYEVDKLDQLHLLTAGLTYHLRS